MKRLIYLVSFFFAASHLSAQIDYPYAVAGPSGIYVMCGNEIPRNFTYMVYRSEEGKSNWELLKSLKFNNNFDEFYNDLVGAGSRNSIYTLPPENNKGRIWSFIQQNNDVDSIPFFGGLPIYREALGVAYYDRELSKDTKYQYKIEKSRNAVSENVKITGAVHFPGPLVDYKIGSLSQSAAEDRINMRFHIEEKGSLYTVRIMRQNYMQSDFIQLPEVAGLSYRNDSLLAWAIDTLVQKKAIYQYFAVPYDIYGNPGYPSDTIRITNLIYTPEALIMGMHTQSLTEENAIEITWKCEIPVFLRSIDIYRSTDYDKGYERIGSAAPKDTAFIDGAVKPIVSYYYYLVVNNAYGRSERSARISGMLEANSDAIAPFDLKVKTETGRVVLSWRKPTGDTRGYYIMRSENSGETYRQISNLIITDTAKVVFIDSLVNVRTTTLAYAVKSENTSYRISDMTEPVHASPTLLIPLAAPLNARAIYRDDMALVTWDDATIFDNNVSSYNVYRKTLDTDGSDLSDYKLLPETVYNHRLNYCEDKTISEGMNYAYSVESVGLKDSRSAMSIPALIRIPIFWPLSIVNLVAHKTEAGNYIEWQRTMQDNIKEYKIYRLVEENEPQLLATLSSDITSYTDNIDSSEESYFYTVTCVNKKNIESKIDEWFMAY